MLSTDASSAHNVELYSLAKLGFYILKVCLQRIGLCEKNSTPQRRAF